MHWVLVISMFSPSGDFIQKHKEGPIKSEKECIARKSEFNNQPDLYGIQFKTQCVKVKKEANEYPI